MTDEPNIQAQANYPQNPQTAPKPTDPQPNWTSGLAQPHPRDYPEEQPKVGHIKTQEEIKKIDDNDPKKDDKPEKVDHFKEIAELVSGLAETSPSGANTIGQKIMYHVNALADPAAFDKTEAEKHKTEKKQAHEDAEKLKKFKADRKKAEAA